VKSSPLLYALLFGVFWNSGAAAQTVPRLDVEATCRAARPLVATDRNVFESCMRDETAAERELQGIWSGASASHRDTCAREAQTGGTPSYVDMLTCLQLAQGSPLTIPRRERQGTAAPN
jgi:hypothetical protein